MANEKNENRSQDQRNTQQPDRKNVNLAQEDPGAEMGQQENQRGTSDWQNGTHGAGEGEQSEKSSSDSGKQGI